MALPRMPRSSLKLPSSCDGAINPHCRYPSGILTPKIGEPSPSAMPAVNGAGAMHAITAAANSKIRLRFIDRAFVRSRRKIPERNSARVSAPGPKRSFGGELALRAGADLALEEIADQRDDLIGLVLEHEVT